MAGVYRIYRSCFRHDGTMGHEMFIYELLNPDGSHTITGSPEGLVIYDGKIISSYATYGILYYGGRHMKSYLDKTDIITLTSTKVSDKTISVTIVNTDVQKELTSISAVYNQGSTVVYPNSSLDTIKQGLIVTANYSDSTSGVITSYSLNGTLTEGVSTITVSYQGQTTTFNVTVSELPVLESITANYAQGGEGCV